MEDIVKLTQDLIRFKTVQSEPAEIQRCVSFIQDYLTTQIQGSRAHVLVHLQQVLSVLRLSHEAGGFM